MPQGREILLRLVRNADVLTENYRRGTLEKLGLGYDVLAEANPGLIYCAVSGYGRDGPLCRQGRLRPDRAGVRRPDVGHGRARAARR